MTREQREQHRRRTMTALWLMWEYHHPEMNRNEIRGALQKDLKLSPVTSFKSRKARSR